jgi:hypothetical protein
MKRYLVIAHYEGDRTPVKQAMYELNQAGEAEFHVVVPATPYSENTWTWTEREAYDAAQARLKSTLTELQSGGAHVTGEVLSKSSLGAVEQALQQATYDGVIVATPPDADARTPFSEFEFRIRRLTQIPIRHVVAENAKPVERV